MWRPELFAALADLSGPGTTAATFSAAGVVKRGLQQAGFAITKVPGFGRKREMLTAARIDSDDLVTPDETAVRGKHSVPWDLPRNRTTKDRKSTRMNSSNVATSYDDFCLHI